MGVAPSFCGVGAGAGGELGALGAGGVAGANHIRAPGRRGHRRREQHLANAFPARFSDRCWHCLALVAGYGQTLKLENVGRKMEKCIYAVHFTLYAASS